MDFEIRLAAISDKEWLYTLYCSTMRKYIEKTWGWDEEFQKNGFKTNLHPTKFKIIVVNGNEVGAYVINEESGHYWLEMILITPKMQKYGLGTAIIDKLQTDSEKGGKPLKLSVLKVNPAKEFYSRLGFHVYDEDDSFYKMAWAYNNQIQPTQKSRG